MQSATYLSADDEGLNEVVMGAARAAAGPEHEPVGILEIDEVHGQDAQDGLHLSIEAAFGFVDGHGVIQTLGVRGILASSGPDMRSIVDRALARFGGSRVTSVCVAETRGAAEICDVTVCFPAKIPLYAVNTALSKEGMTPAEQELCSEIFSILGVAWTAHGNAPSVARRQLRRLMTPQAQLEAFCAAADRGARVSLYASAVPATQSVWVESGPGPRGRYLDVFVSRGLSSTTHCTAADSAEMQRFFSGQLGAEFGAKRWAVENSAGDAELPAPRPRRRLPWPSMLARR